MKKNKFLSAIFITVLASLIISLSCNKNKSDPPGGGTSNSDQDPILLNIGNNIILPSYQSLQQAVNALDAGITDFNVSPDAAKLSNIQTLFKTAYTAWQSASEYNYFGPAQNTQPAVTSINIFPVNASLIDNNIAAGNNNINTFANTSAKGFGALDYLLFGSDNASLLTKFITDANAAKRKSYVSALSADIKTIVTTVVNGWLPSGGNYIKTFLDGKGNDLSSSLGLLMNSSEQDFEILKNDRLGIPLGKIPVGSNLPLAPNEVEAYYSGISNQLALAQLKAVQLLYLGNNPNGNGQGLLKYLQQAEAKNSNLKYHGGLLSDTIKVNFEKAAAYLQNIPNPLSANLSNSNALPAFNTCQYLVTLTKTDMTSDIGVLINYGDNDGD